MAGKRIGTDKKPQSRQTALVAAKGRSSAEKPNESLAKTEQAKSIHAVNEQLSGPVLEIYKRLLPDLNPMSYQDILASPELVYGCFLIFEKQRDLFLDLLKNEAGQPVSNDDEELWCGRTTNDVCVLVIRTSAKKYFRTHCDQFRDVSEIRQRPNSTVNAGLLERLFGLVSRMWHGMPAHQPAVQTKMKRKSGADVFYESIAPYIRHRWQVPLIPYYAALPQSLIEEVGEGLLSMQQPSDLEFLLRIGRKDFNEAQRLTGDLAREMLDTDPRAAKGVTHAGQAEYERLLNGLHEHMGARFWKVFTGMELLDSLENKNTADIVEMASHLDRVGPETVDSLIGSLQRPQIAPFLRVAETQLENKDFDAVFGMSGDPRLARTFAKRAAQLRLDPQDPDDFEKQLPFIFQAYKAAPASFARQP